MPQPTHVRLVPAEKWEHLRALPRVEEETPVQPIPLRGRTVVVRLDDARTEDWFSPDLRKRADDLLEALEAAGERGRTRRQTRLLASLLGVIQADRLARARAIAAERRLRMDPTGRGPVVHSRAVHLRDRLPWRLTPLDERTPLPERVARVKDAWDAERAVFDVFYLVDEPAGASPVPCHCLIGVLSADGAVGDWFILDRWGS